MYPAFSPNGKWLAYTAVESAPGRPSFQVSRELYVRPFPLSASGHVVHVSNNGGTNQMWSRARNDLLYQQPRGGSIMAVTYTEQGGEFKADKARVWLSNSVGLSRNFDLDSSGNRIAMVMPVTTPEQAQAEPPNPEHTVVFLLNFLDYLRQRVPASK